MTEAKGRGRPPKDQPTHKLIDNLDALEQQKSANRADDYRPSSIKKSRLDWSDKDPNYYYRWFTERNTAYYLDTPQGALELGYEFVRHKTGDESTKGTKVVDNSTATKLYLMRLPKVKKEALEQERNAITDMKDAQLNEVGSREYGALNGSTGELGKGTAVQQELETQAYKPNPLMK